MVKMDYVIVNATASGEVTEDDNSLMTSYGRAVDGLEEQVRWYLEQGWSLQGGVSMTTTVISHHDDDSHTVWTEVRVMACQAMVRATEVAEGAVAMKVVKKALSMCDYNGIPAMIGRVAMPAAFGAMA